MEKFRNRIVRIHSKPMKDRIYNFCLWAGSLFVTVWFLFAVATGFGFPIT